MIGSIVKSNRSLGTRTAATGKVVFPDMDRVKAMTLKQLTYLSIAKVQSHQSDVLYTLGFTLSDKQTCKAGTLREYNKSYDFPPDQKIVKVDVILTSNNY